MSSIREQIKILRKQVACILAGKEDNNNSTEETKRVDFISISNQNIFSISDSISYIQEFIINGASIARNAFSLSGNNVIYTKSNNGNKNIEDDDIIIIIYK